MTSLSVLQSLSAFLSVFWSANMGCMTSLMIYITSSSVRTWVLCTSTHNLTQFFQLHTLIQSLTHIYTHTQTYTDIHIQIHIHTNTQTHTYTYTHKHTQTYTYRYTYTQTHRHTHTHTHTDTHKRTVHEKRIDVIFYKITT